MNCTEIRLTESQADQYRSCPRPGPATSFVARLWAAAEQLSDVLHEYSGMSYGSSDVYIVDPAGATLAAIQREAGGFSIREGGAQ